ncbi:MAG: Inner membrane protein YqjA [Syntrophus sp. PtaU1.Bin005]|jgi:membrane-associated protein|uniref:DedA family protein n=1 Tax=Syntrophus TaxID=43773 RepID=UPI0009CEC671|nr:MAG: Inner membrane protein YqjA [Syntrophus sp. PtaB.Bin138]OPY80071.1 MAG: Inner membrane protein YqjA [Syntrophus sp. PtaU1.Bin005]
MEILVTVIDFFVHLDRYLSILVSSFGVWAYVILFLIIFCETGLVVTPFLPGDSLLFGLGALAAAGALELDLLLLMLPVAAVAGDNVNYTLGKYIGPRVFHQNNPRFFKREYLDRTHRFYERHGGKTIVLARFLPIVRTFSPFVAGIGRMAYLRFLSYSIAGGLFWVVLFLLGGYYFGNLPLVKENFTLVILAIIIVSLLPGFFELIRRRRGMVEGFES